MTQQPSFLKYLQIVLLSAVVTLTMKAQPSMLMVKKSADRNFRISRNSSLKLEGQTNINGFTCDCNEVFQPQSLSFEVPDASGLVANFKQTNLNISVENLDCGNKLMNKDLQKALNAETYPFITIELLQIKQDHCNRLTEMKDWIKIKALIRLNINGCSQDYWLDITTKKLDDNRFRFIGSKKFFMSSFGVTPPTAMMGMVKVEDEIRINLDLEIVVE